MGISSKTRAMIAVAVTMMLAGCFEIEKDIAFRDDGGARVQLEIAVATEVMAMLSDPSIAEAVKAKGAPNILGECGKPWPKDRALPDGVRSIESRLGKRDDMVTCTIVLDVPDPIRAIESAKKFEVPNSAEMPKQDLSLTRLDGASGYRLRLGMTPPTSPNLPPETEKMAAALIAAMFTGRYMIFSISAERIEKTNGELAPDGRKATWKFPLASIANLATAKPASVDGDIIYAR